MSCFRPEDLAAWSGGQWQGRKPGPLGQFRLDSRRIQEGDVFVALTGGQRDGHDFLTDAMERGASAAVVSQPVSSLRLAQLVVPDTESALQTMAARHRLGFAGTIIGITGSCGKTLAKDVLALLLGEEEAVLSTEGNRNNHLGLPETLLRLDSRRHKLAVIETGISRAGDMALLASILRPDHALLTSIAPAHLEGLGSLEGIAREKSVLLHSVPGRGSCVLPVSTREYRECGRFAAQTIYLAQAREIFSPGFENGVVLWNRSLSQKRKEPRLSLVADDGREWHFRAPVWSQGQCATAVLALWMALMLGREPCLIQEGLDRWRPASLRGELKTRGRSWTYLDCYNANPASLQDALEHFQELTEDHEPRLFIIGTMEELGPESAFWHHKALAPLHWRPGDLVVCLGSQRDAMAEALNIRVGPAGYNPVYRGACDDDSLRALLAGFPGPAFLKGSRIHHLEDLLPVHQEPRTTVS